MNEIDHFKVFILYSGELILKKFQNKYKWDLILFISLRMIQSKNGI
jgi:hypothetical protein